MSLDTEASALLIYCAAWTKDNSADRITREAAMAKLFATEATPTCYRRSCTIFWWIRCGFRIRCLATLSGNPCAQDLWRCFWGSKTNYCLADTQW